MGVDTKYGRVTVEHERRLCEANDCEPEHLAGIVASRAEIVDWQRVNGTLRPGDKTHS